MLYGGTGWLLGHWKDYDRDYALDLKQLAAFRASTQPNIAEAVGLEHDSPARQKLLARLQGEITKRGVIDVLRHGLKHGALNVDLFYGTPTPGNVKAEERFASNRFSVARQLRYSKDETQLALDLGLFINGLPVATFELKNSLTKQTVEDAVEQYKLRQNSAPVLFEVGLVLTEVGRESVQVSEDSLRHLIAVGALEGHEPLGGCHNVPAVAEAEGTEGFDEYQFNGSVATFQNSTRDRHTLEMNLDDCDYWGHIFSPLHGEHIPSGLREPPWSLGFPSESAGGVPGLPDALLMLTHSTSV